MRKNNALRSLVLLSSLVLSPGLVLADNPVTYGVTVYCPNTQGGSNIITNFGNYIAGYGVEYILNYTTQAYFRSASFIQNVPASLTNYANASVEYNSTTGIVSCLYQSSIQTEAAFSVSYYLTNGFGGSIQSQASNTITISLPAGLRG